MTRMLKDKSISSIIDYYNNDYQQVERVYPHQSGLYTNLYNLTYQPTHIIDNIYLGNAYNASNYTCLSEKNISFVINITEEIPNYYPDDLKYYNIIIKDSNASNIKSHLNNVVELLRTKYLESMVSEKPAKPNILVHCFMGSSRSATLVIAYLMKYHNLSVDEALQKCKELRPLVNINTTFYQNLKDWEVSELKIRG